VLEPIFEADLPPEQYAYRPGRNAQQAVVEVGALLYRGHPEVDRRSQRQVENRGVY
jgi:RNA-directed DNA polymerase